MYFSKKNVHGMAIDGERLQTDERYMFRLNTSLRSHQALVTNIAYTKSKYNTLVKMGIEISV